MYSYSNKSKEKLATTHPDLQRLFNEVIKVIDCTILFGHRSLEVQQGLYAKGRTTEGNKVTNCDGVHHKSKHQDGLAVDACCYPLDWDDREAFYHLAGIVLGIASQLDIEITWGGSWSDLPHFELK